MASDCPNHDNLFSSVYESKNQSLPAFFDAVFGWLARESPDSLNSTNGISLEHIVSQGISKWRAKLSEDAPTEASKTCRDADQLSTSASNRADYDVPEAVVEVECSTDDAKPQDSSAEKSSYSWSQTIDDVELRIPIPSCISKGKQVSVVVESTKLRVTIQGEVIFQGCLHKPIDTEESVWDLTPKQFLNFHLNKKESVWWNTDSAIVGLKGAVEGAEEAERSYYSLGQEERAQIERVMFDAQQKAAGEPTSSAMEMKKVLREAWEAEDSPFKGQPFDLRNINLAN